MSVKPTSSTSAKVELQGLEPGETVTLIFKAEVPGHHFSQTEEQPVQQADVNGHYAYEVLGLRPLPGSTVNQWQVQVVHKRGVACSQVILP
ncbi:hypothetical protein FBQ82_07265 [Anaerolineae bacterium CFX7]|nr:hypothetical protein [Anaerolineae bacterium CFX7]RIK55097.1 MAG: hypothetical protein DCC62_31530 [candidate division KSB1 bacterium]